MKKVAIAILSLTALASCKEGGSNTAFEPKTFMDSVSYSIGADMGLNVRKGTSDGMDSINVDALMAGVRNGIDSSSVFTEEQKKDIMRDFKLKMNDALTSNAKKEHDEFLKSVSEKEGIVTLPSGLMYKVISEGAGSKPDANDTVVVNYVGKYSDGTTFDSNEGRGEARFPTGGVVAGLKEGLPLMSIGSKYEFYMPFSLGYGERGIPSQQGFQGIPPFSPLVFEMELLDIVEVSDAVHAAKMEALQKQRQQQMEMQQQLQQQQQR